MCSSIPQGGSFIDPKELPIQVGKRTDMVIAVMKGLRIADSQESCFEVC